MCCGLAARRIIAFVPYDSRIATPRFLVTDVPGSTALLRGVGDRTYSEILAPRHGIVRASVVRHGGREEGPPGDSFFTVFTSAIDCAVAAIEIQLELRAHEWPGDVNLLARMGIHTGEAATTSTGLVGYDVHRRT